MSKRMLIVFLLVLLATLTGCKAAPAEPTAAAKETGYPVDGAYPVEDVYMDTGLEQAYPVNEADLQNLYGTWTLTAYIVDGAEGTPSPVTMTFNEDGSFTRETEQGLVQGTWAAEIMLYPQLILTSNSQEVQVYNLLALNSGELRLQSNSDGTLVEEVYSPAN